MCHSAATSSIGTTRGGSLMIRRESSSCRVSLLERAQAVLVLRLRDPALQLLAAVRAHARAEPLDGLGVHPRVPDIEITHRGEPADLPPILAGRGDGERTPLALVEAPLSSRDREARREPFHVPLERPRIGLVEVVDVEDHPAVGRHEDTEVRQVSVPAELSLEARARHRRQIGRHDSGRSSVEGERRDEHPPVPDRNQRRRSLRVLALERLHGIGPVGGRFPLPLCLSPQAGPHCLSRRLSLARCDRWSRGHGLSLAPNGSDVSAAHPLGRLR